MEYISEETHRQSIEANLEEFYECPLRIKIELEKKNKPSEDLPQNDSIEEPRFHEQYGNDPTAMIVQKVFNVTIRNVFQDAPPVQYHLGMSSNFKED